MDIDWNFGDGNSASETGVADTSQTHTYTATGSFDVTVNISNIKSFKFNQTQVCVQERITGFGILFPTASYVEVGVPSALRLGMTKGSDYTCTLSFDDGIGPTPDIRTTDESSTPPNTDYSYTFSSAGDYTVSAICENGIVGATAMDSLTTRGVERPDGLALDPPGAEAGQPFRIYVTWTSGTDLTLDVTYNGNSVNMQFINGERKARSDVMPATSTGRVPVTVTLSNVISSEVLNVDFAIEIEITNLVITCNFLSEIITSLPSPNVVIPTNSDVECSVTMQDGTSVTLTIIWGDSASYNHSVAVGDSWASDPAPDPITHSFMTPDICSMTVIVGNGFGSFRRDYIVNVMTSVNNVEINGVSPIEFTPPANVTFTWR